MDCPSEFVPGHVRQEELGLNFDVSYAATDRLNIAAGRLRGVMTGLRSAGDRIVRQSAPTRSRVLEPGRRLSASQAWSGGWNRNSRAVYGDLELRDLDGAWTIGGAVRFEHFDLFGATTNGKLSGRYRFAPSVALRGSVGSGFRSADGWTAICTERADHARLERESGR